jgi:hypothetical protein
MQLLGPAIRCQFPAAPPVALRGWRWNPDAATYSPLSAGDWLEVGEAYWFDAGAAWDWNAAP